MKISIENCNNIDKGEIEIVPNTLNIKYASNGTGKSTIAKAIEAFVTKNEKKKKLLIPYKYLDSHKKPDSKVTGIEDIKSVAIFNDEYVNQFLFQKDQTSRKEILIKDSFSIFVKTPEYDENMKRISNQLQQITQNIQNNEKLTNIITLFEQFIKKCGTGYGIAANAAIKKTLDAGNMLASIAPKFQAYSSFLQDRKNFNNATWVGWAEKGKVFLNDGHSCPFCLSTDNQENIETIKEITKQYTENSLKELTDVLETFKGIKIYLDKDNQSFLDQIEQEAKGLDDNMISRLGSIKKAITQGLNAFKELKNLRPSSLDNIEDLINKIQEKRISFSREDLQILDSPATNELAEELNELLNQVYIQAKTIKDDLNKQNELIRETVATNQENINTFLQTAGYNYQVEINQKNDEANIYLKPFGYDNNINNVKEHLSYGERNAFAMVLFMYSAIKQNPDLIVLDDPISSFDGNKKFALLNMMFLPTQNNSSSEDPSNVQALLQNKTVLLLTHDFTTILDIIHTLHKSFPNAQAHFLKNTKGQLNEQKIENENFSSVIKITESLIKITNDNLIKAIHLRRLFELRGEKQEAYNMISCLLHKQTTPTIRLGKDQKEKKKNRTPIIDCTYAMNEDEKNIALAEIKKYIKDFDYQAEVNKATDDKALQELYNKSDEYNKVLIFRIFMENRQITSNNVIRKYINELFHIENDAIYQLMPTTFNTVPQYIIDECDKIMNGN